MQKLPDLEGFAIFAKVVELRSFSAVAAELALSKATISKAVTRLERRVGARLFNRTSRRLTLTDVGQSLAVRAAAMLAEADAAENEAQAHAAAPRGLVRLAVPMSFGLIRIAPILPEFLAAYPDIVVDLHLSDATVDLIGEGFDAALRIAVLPDSSLVARRVCDVRRHVVATSSYFDRFGRPKHPAQLGEHRCLGYAYTQTPHLWRFANAAGEEVSVRLAGPLRANNGDALVPALLAGLGIAVLPDFIVGGLLAEGGLEEVLPDWTLPVGGLHLVMPPGGRRPRRVEALLDFLMQRLRPDSMAVSVGGRYKASVGEGSDGTATWIQRLSERP
jgi:DNA-binding transcriptional LysR family regulator